MERERLEATPRWVEETLEYFLRNPQAADSLEGLARWRLLTESVHRSVEQVDQALQWLVVRGFLVQAATRDVYPVFSLNLTNVEAARSLLVMLRERHVDPRTS